MIDSVGPLEQSEGIRSTSQTRLKFDQRAIQCFESNAFSQVSGAHTNCCSGGRGLEPLRAASNNASAKFN